jgi:MFS family permease
MLGERSGLAVLAETNFRRFFIGNATSLLGEGMVTVALSFAILDLTGSPADLGYVLAARTVPRLVILLIGGVIGDRSSRRRMLITADLTRWAGQGVVAALLISGHARMWELIILLAVHGAATGVFNPAMTRLLPAIASDDHLQQANAMRGVAISAGTIIGPALAGLVVAAAGPGWTRQHSPSAFFSSQGWTYRSMSISQATPSSVTCATAGRSSSGTTGCALIFLAPR